MRQIARDSWRIMGLSLIFSAVLFAQSEYTAHRRHQERPGKFWSQLSDSQKTEMQTLISALKDQKVDRDSIRSAIHEKLAGWGIQRGPRDIPPRLAEKLTEPQKTELENLIADLKSQNTAPREIRQAVNKKLEEWGVPHRPPKSERVKDRAARHHRSRMHEDL